MFWQRETLYHYCMTSTLLFTGKPWLSCDHMFRSVSNIGTVSWIKQYNGLFCILNADGHVLSWKLTKSLSFEHIEDSLYALQQRFQRNGQQLEEFYVDTYCSLRCKLQKIFGSKLMQCNEYPGKSQNVTPTTNSAFHH